MNKAIDLSEERNKIVSFVIARKKVDHYYNKFSFDWQMKIILPIQYL